MIDAFDIITGSKFQTTGPKHGLKVPIQRIIDVT